MALCRVGARPYFVNTSILPDRGEPINGYASTLSRRLRSGWLARALAIVASALTELGGGPERVEQRLRSTLAWCRSPGSSALRVDSLPEEIAADHYRQQLGGTAVAHHKQHLARVRGCVSELRPPEHERRALLKQATALVERVRRINLQNLSNTKNRLLPPGEWRRNFLAADARSRSREAASFRRETIQALESLRQAGWGVYATTVTLPAGYHPKSAHRFGLAGSPSIQDAADALRRLWAGSKPGPGLWRLETHADGTIHMHTMTAYATELDQASHQARLRDAYLRETYRGWNSPVVTGFGLVAPPWECWSVPIHIDRIRDTDHLIKAVHYATKALCPLVSLVPGRSRGVTGKLLADAQLSQQSQQKVSCIKTYQDQDGGPRVSARPALPAPPAPQSMNAWSRVASRPRISILARWSPPARAPPDVSIRRIFASVDFRVDHGLQFSPIGGISMTRKNPLEQIEAARKALQRAQARQRQADTRARVILGGYLLAWMRDDHRVRQALAARLSERPLRPQDADALAPLLDELTAPQTAAAAQSQRAQQNAEASPTLNN